MAYKNTQEQEELSGIGEQASVLDVESEGDPGAFILTDDSERESPQKESTSEAGEETKQEQGKEKETTDQDEPPEASEKESETKSETAESEDEESKEKEEKDEEKETEDKEKEKSEEEEKEDKEKEDKDKEEKEKAESEKEEEQPEKKDSETMAEFKERVKKLAPDKEFKSDDDMIAEAMSVMDNYDQMVKDHEQNKQEYTKLMESLESEPAMANVLKDLKDGATLNEALFMNVDVDSIESEVEDQPDFETMKKRKQEREQKFKEAKEQHKIREENNKKSLENIKTYAEEKGWDNRQVSKFIDSVRDTLEEYDNGLISKDFLGLLDKALSADQQVEKVKSDMEKKIKDAREAGRIEGRNEKIQSGEVKKQTKKSKGDGMPHLKGNTKVQQEAPEEESPWTNAILEDEDRRKPL